MDLPIKTISLIALGLMVVVLIFLSFDTFFSNAVDDFISNLDFNPEP